MASSETTSESLPLDEEETLSSVHSIASQSHYEEDIERSETGTEERSAGIQGQQPIVRDDEVITATGQFRGGSLQRILRWLLFESPEDRVAKFRAFCYSYRAHAKPKQLWQLLMGFLQQQQQQQPHQQQQQQQQLHTIPVPAPAEQSASRHQTQQNAAGAVYAFVREWVSSCLESDFLRAGGKSPPLFGELLNFLVSVPRDEANQIKLACLRAARAFLPATSYSPTRSFPPSLSAPLDAPSSAVSFGSAGANEGAVGVSSVAFSLQQPLVSAAGPTGPFGAAGGGGGGGGEAESGGGGGSTQQASMVSGCLSAAALAAVRGVTAATLLDAGVPTLALAQQLTAQERQLLERVRAREFLGKAWQVEGGRRAPRLSALAQRFNRVSYWIATAIVTAPDVRQASRRLKKCIKLAERLHHLQNFNGLMAVLAGLNHASVQRLKRLWLTLDAKKSEAYARLDELMAPHQNYRQYRAAVALAQAAGRPVVPYVALFLRDVTYVQDGNADAWPGAPGLLNAEKLLLLGQRIDAFLRLRVPRYSFPSLPAELRLALDAIEPLSDEELYARSELLEPKRAPAPPLPALAPAAVAALPLPPPLERAEAWSVAELQAHLLHAGLAAPAELLRVAGVDGARFLALDQAQLLAIGVLKLGHRKRLLKQVCCLRQQLASAAATTTSSSVLQPEFQQQEELPLSTEALQNAGELRREADDWRHWSVSEVGHWLEELGLGEHRTAFQEYGIQGADLPGLHEADLLHRFGVSKVGHRKKLLRALLDLQQRPGVLSSSSSSSSPPTASSATSTSTSASTCTSTLASAPAPTLASTSTSALAAATPGVPAPASVPVLSHQPNNALRVKCQCGDDIRVVRLSSGVWDSAQARSLINQAFPGQRLVLRMWRAGHRRGHDSLPEQLDPPPMSLRVYLSPEPRSRAQPKVYQ